MFVVFPEYTLESRGAPVAQQDRASASGAEGCGFNSRRAHQFFGVFGESASLSLSYSLCGMLPPGFSQERMKWLLGMVHGTISPEPGVASGAPGFEGWEYYGFGLGTAQSPRRDLAVAPGEARTCTVFPQFSP